jgi:hypothetical protein
VLERYPFAHAAAQAAIESVEANAGPDAVPIVTIRAELPVQLRRRLASTADGLPEPTPRVPASRRWASAVDELVDACDGFLPRAEI